MPKPRNRVGSLSHAPEDATKAVRTERSSFPKYPDSVRCSYFRPWSFLEAY